MGSAARLRHRPDQSRAVLGRAPGRGWFAVPGAPKTVEKGMAHLQVGPDRGQSAREILSDYAGRQETAAPRGIAVDRAGGGDWPRHEPSGRPEGVNVAWFGWVKSRRLDAEAVQEATSRHTE